MAFTISQSLFSQNLRLDGYRGLWYGTDQAFQYGLTLSGGVATFSPRHRPVAIYSPEVNKTFFVYSGTISAEERHLVIMISYYDHKLGKVPRPVLVYDKLGVKEPFDNASLVIDNAGHLWIFISGRARTRPAIVFKSTNPWSIDKFELKYQCEMITPQPWCFNNGRIGALYSKQTSGIEIWFSDCSLTPSVENSTKIAGFGGHYKISGMNRDKLYVAFNYYPPGEFLNQANLYLLYSDDFGKTWKTTDNNQAIIPLSKIDNEALICDFISEKIRVFLLDMDFDSDGYPVLLVITSRNSDPVENQFDGTLGIVHRVNNSWDLVEICDADNINDSGTLSTQSGYWEVLASAGHTGKKGVAGGEITRWISKNEGLNWIKDRDVTYNSQYPNSFVRRPLNARKDFHAIWADGDPEKISESKLYFTNSEGNKVWVLPYEMVSDFKRPQRIR